MPNFCIATVLNFLILTARSTCASQKEWNPPVPPKSKGIGLSKITSLNHVRSSFQWREMQPYHIGNVSPSPARPSVSSSKA